MRFILILSVVLASTTSAVAQDQVGLLGAWTVFRTVDEETMKAFETATKDKIGADTMAYTPLAVSTQIVSGIKYNFFCHTASKSTPPKEGNALIEFYVDLQGKNDKPKITNLHPIDGNGAYTAFKKPSDEAQKVFDKTVGKLAENKDQKIVLLAYGTQVVAGLNYQFIYQTTTNDESLKDKSPREENSVAVVYANLQGETTVTSDTAFNAANFDELFLLRKKNRKQ